MALKLMVFHERDLQRVAEVVRVQHHEINRMLSEFVVASDRGGNYYDGDYIYWGYIGIMENKMETTIMYIGHHAGPQMS